MFMSVRYINGSVGPFLQQAGQLLHLCYKTPHLNVFARHNMMKLFRRLSEGGPGLLDIIDRIEKHPHRIKADNMAITKRFPEGPYHKPAIPKSSERTPCLVRPDIDLYALITM